MTFENYILICPICGDIDVTKEHINECTDIGKKIIREEENDNLWK